MTTRLFNYLKAHRKRDGFKQDELSYLVGAAHRSKICRIEKGERYPSVAEMIAFEAIFQKNMSKLFPDLYAHISSKVLYRIDQFQQHLEQEPVTEETIRKQVVLKRMRTAIAAENRRRL